MGGVRRGRVRGCVRWARCARPQSPNPAPQPRRPRVRAPTLPPRARPALTQWGAPDIWPRETRSIGEAGERAAPAPGPGARLPAPGLRPPRALGSLGAGPAPRAHGEGAGLWEAWPGAPPRPAAESGQSGRRTAGSAQGCVRRPRPSVAGRGLGAIRGTPRPPPGTVQVRPGPRGAIRSLRPCPRRGAPHTPGGGGSSTAWETPHSWRGRVAVCTA